MRVFDYLRHHIDHLLELVPDDLENLSANMHRKTSSHLRLSSQATQRRQLPERLHEDANLAQRSLPVRTETRFAESPSELWGIVSLRWLWLESDSRSAEAKASSPYSGISVYSSSSSSVYATISQLPTAVKGYSRHPSQPSLPSHHAPPGFPDHRVISQWRATPKAQAPG